VRLALAGDTMIGRGVRERLDEAPPESLFAPELVEATRAADLVIVNLECCISERGSPARGRVFHFRAPPAAVDALAHLGVSCVGLANNHALDYGPEALVDTLEYLRAAGIRWAGAGSREAEARAAVDLEAGGERLRVVAFSDHPVEYAAGSERPGIALDELSRGRPSDWLLEAMHADGTEAVLAFPHWGPNMTSSPPRYVRRAATALLEAGATLIAGHSAHVFHGTDGPVLFDLGDFVDDYRVDEWLRNDLGLLWFVDLDLGRVARIEALPLKLEYCHTRVAGGDDWTWIARRLRAACREFGTAVEEEDGRLVIAV
jgi:poly-gamma-glutamate capsule biosynthesis protein CapA/YwtB (metallophosphatase superfamily)